MPIEDNNAGKQPVPAIRPPHRLGVLADSGRIVGDIVSPASDENDWNVLRQDQAEDCDP
ncbi:MAG TPA: hypothetical protein PKJ41_18590 [Bryobacteraceae bacterium]|nr:hypothetical protein [Bryobacteraceae bacterium]